MEEDEDVVFMYTVAEGPCSKSHGFNAAKLAGLPEEIISNGRKVAEKFEKDQDNLLKLNEILCIWNKSSLSYLKWSLGTNGFIIMAGNTCLENTKIFTLRKKYMNTMRIETYCTHAHFSICQNWNRNIFV